MKPSQPRRFSVFYQSLLVLLWIIAPVSLSQAATPAQFDRSVDQACNRIKVCISEKMLKEQSLPKEMQPILMGTLDSVCMNIKQRFDRNIIVKHKELLDTATTCLQKMSTASCNLMSIDNINKLPSPCDQLRALAKKYTPSTNAAKPRTSEQSSPQLTQAK